MKKINSNLTCAICGKESEQEISLSSSTFGMRTHLDLRVVGSSLDNLVQQCPHCHYTYFNIEKDLGLSLKDIESKEYQEILNADINDLAKKFILCAILCDKANQTKNAGIMYHHASWVFDDINDIQNADKYRKMACERILEVAIKEEDGDTTIQCLDLLRRNGNYKKALELIDEIGKTDIEEIDKVVAFEKELIKKQDKNAHFVDEISEK